MHALINNAHLYIVEQGSRSETPVMFLHGFPFSHRMWQHQLNVVGARFRAIAYDIKGHGSSDVADGQYSIEGHVDDLFSVMDHLQIERAVVVGLSMGGYITLRALERNPERFIAAALCNTRSEADTNEGKVNRAIAAAKVKTSGSPAYADEFVQKVFWEQSLRRKPVEAQMIRDIISHTPPLSIAGTLLALAGRTDTTASLETIRVPVLLLVGEYDAITPPACSQSMQGRIPGSELHVIPDAGHMSPLENPEAFNAKLLPFLERVAVRS
jgi:3-oxoadipate enol-lactonase